jgi:hypothetical protein
VWKQEGERKSASARRSKSGDGARRRAAAVAGDAAWRAPLRASRRHPLTQGDLRDPAARLAAAASPGCAFLLRVVCANRAGGGAGSKASPVVNGHNYKTPRTEASAQPHLEVQRPRRALGHPRLLHGRPPALHGATTQTKRSHALFLSLFGFLREKRRTFAARAVAKRRELSKWVDRSEGSRERERTSGA